MLFGLVRVNDDVANYSSSVRSSSSSFFFYFFFSFFFFFILLIFFILNNIIKRQHRAYAPEPCNVPDVDDESAAEGDNTIASAISAVRPLN